MNLDLKHKLITLEQMIIFSYVVSEGSFLRAGRKLGRVQGAISYNIQSMEDILGYKLFDRSKKTKLTKLGQAFAKDVKELLLKYQEVLSHNQKRKEGLETALSITFDIVFPIKEQVKLIREFKKAFPSVNLNTRTGILKSCTDDLLDERSELAIVGVPNFSDDYEFVACGTVKFIPLAAKRHPLAQKTKVTDEELELHTHILLTDGREKEKTPTNFQMYKNHWRVNDVRIRNDYLAAGFGWARAPKHQVNDLLKSNKVIPILSKQWTEHHLRAPLFLAFHKSLKRGPAISWWIEQVGRYENQVF